MSGIASNPPGDPYWEAKHLWYKGCVERACQYPVGSFLYCFWWSLRDELSKDEVIRQWAKNPEGAIEGWHTYFQYVWENLERHRRRS